MKTGTLFLLALPAMMVASDVEAVIGRPLTPMSYAGVARRTTRRAVVATAAVASTAAVAATVHALPPGCAQSVYGAMTYHNCSGTYYQPQYEGPNVVYVQVPPPQQQPQG